jgi:hypothetical protein
VNIVISYVLHFLIFALVWILAFVAAHKLALDGVSVGWIMVIGYWAGRFGFWLANFCVPSAA